MFSIYKKLGWFFKQEKYRYIFLVFLCIISTFLMTLPPKYLGLALDGIGTGQITSELFYGLVVKMAIVSVLLYFGFNLRQRLSQNGSFKLQYILRNQLMKYLEAKDAHYYNDHETGDLMAVATQDVNNICMASSQILLQLVSSVFTLCFVIGQMIFSVHLKLTLLTIIPLPIGIWMVYFMSKKIRNLFILSRDAFGEFNNSTLESVAGVQVNRAFVQEKNDIIKLRDVADNARDREKEAVKLDSAFGPLFRIVYSIAVTISLGFGLYLVFNRVITAGELVTFNLYLSMLRMPMWGIGMVLNRLQRAQASYDRFETTTMVNNLVEQPINPLPINTIESIEFVDYSFTYPKSEFESLKDISFKIKKGQTVGVIGKTGSGKSTLIQQLLRYYKVGSGGFLINNEPVTMYDLIEVRKHYAYVPQEHVLFSKTVKENIELGFDGVVSEEMLDRAIELADFKKDLKYLRDGLNTLCGEDGTMLSGGQKQRLSIARAFIANPEILILDDSLSAVDGNTEANIISSLKQSRASKTNIIIAHRLSAIRHADFVIVLDDGKIIEHGTHEELLKLKGWYYEQFTNQSLQSGGEV